MTVQDVKVFETIKKCQALLDHLNTLKNSDEKILFLKKHVGKIPQNLESLSHTLSKEEVFVIYAVFAIGQGEVVFHPKSPIYENIDSLLKVEEFYQTHGGIIGYHLQVLKLAFQNQEVKDQLCYYKPPFFSIVEQNQEVTRCIKSGIEHLPFLGEMYAVGGSGDRLNLKDPVSKKTLPVAAFVFCGKTLIEGMIRDVQAKEYLYYKLHGKQLTIPVALMTSEDTSNHDQILKIFQKAKWFCRLKESFFFFKQPLVPVISKKGDWLLDKNHYLVLKPGGHGVIWKLAENCGVFNWFLEKSVTKLLIRQVNNPIAGIDYGILATVGYGFLHRKVFGVAACRRKVGAPEGMSVLCEKVAKNTYQYGITNIEYTEFKRSKEAKHLIKKQGADAEFPANTNILFADIAAIQKAIVTSPIPGMIVNMKSEVGGRLAGRLESTMQNIADVLMDTFDKKQEVSQHFHLHTFLTYNERIKTISVTKKSVDPAEEIDGTPLGGFYDLLKNYYTLLHSHCHIKTPEVFEPGEYRKKGPSFVVNLHPAIGPLWSIIEQKIYGGRIYPFSELDLEIAEVDIKQLQLDGSLLVKAKNLLGSQTPEDVTCYDDYCGKCTLHRVFVKNKGIDQAAHHCCFSGKIQRKEKLEIVLYGNAEFEAYDVTFEGDMCIEVPDGYKWSAYLDSGELRFKKEKLATPSWSWKYSYNEDGSIHLQKQDTELTSRIGF